MSAPSPTCLLAEKPSSDRLRVRSQATGEGSGRKDAKTAATPPESGGGDRGMSTTLNSTSSRSEAQTQGAERGGDPLDDISGSFWSLGGVTVLQELADLAHVVHRNTSIPTPASHDQQKLNIMRE